MKQHIDAIAVWHFDESDRRRLAQKLEPIIGASENVELATKEIQQVVAKFQKRIARIANQPEVNQQIKDLRQVCESIKKTTRLLERLNFKSAKRIRLKAATKLGHSWNEGGVLLALIGNGEVQRFVDSTSRLHEAIKDAIERTNSKLRKDRKDGLAELSSLARSLFGILAGYGDGSLPDDHHIAVLLGWIVGKCKVEFPPGSIDNAILRAIEQRGDESDASDKAEDCD